MPDPKEKLKKLHTNLVKDGYDVPTFDLFQKDMSDAGKLSKLRENLVKEGYDLPDFNTFQIDMGFGEKKNQVVSTGGGKAGPSGAPLPSGGPLPKGELTAPTELPPLKITTPKVEGIAGGKLGKETSLKTYGTTTVPTAPRRLYDDLEKLYSNVNEADKKLSLLAAGKQGMQGVFIPQSDIDIATKDLGQAKKLKEETIAKYRTQLEAPVKQLIDNGEYKKFFDADVFNEARAREYFKKITQESGGGSYLVDSWMANLKKQGQFEKDKPRFSQLFNEELFKEKIDFKKYGQKLFDDLAKNQYDNVALIKKDAETEINQAENQSKQQVQNNLEGFNQYVNNLNQDLKAGKITAEQASSMYDEELKNLNNGVKQINDNYLELVRNINLKVNKKYGRVEQELKRISQTISDADILKALPQEDRNKIKFATDRAAARLQNEKNNIKKAAVSTMSTGSLPGANEWSTNLSNSLISGLNSGLASLGDWLFMSGADNRVVDWMRDRKSTAAQFAPPKYEWNKDEWLNRAITSTGTSLGASVPTLLPTIAIGVATRGVGLAPIASGLLSGTTSFAIENAQNAGQQYQQKLEETGDPNVAAQSANELFRKNAITLPFYFIGGLGDMVLLKGGGLRKFITGLGLEQVEEVPTEYLQEFNSAKANGYKGNLGDFIKENPEIAYDTFISTAGQSTAMGSLGNVFSSFSKNIPESKTQLFANMVQNEGLDFAQKTLEKYYTKGILNKAEYENQKAELEKISTGLQELNDAGVKGSDATLMTSLSEKAKFLENKAKTVQSEAVKSFYQKALSEVKSDISELASKNLPYVVFTMPGGQGDTRVMTVREFEKLSEDKANELIKNSDGVQVVNDNSLNASLNEKKKQLGVPADAVEGAYPNQQPSTKNVLEVTPKEAAPQVPAAREITDTEYNEFIDKGIVAPERLNDIAQKVKNQEKLSEREQEIFADKTSDINKIIAGEVTPEAAPEVPVAPVEALKDVESTTKALQSEIDKGFKFTANFGLPFEQLKTPNQVSEAYHKAKAEGTNPVLVKAVEDLLVGEVAPKVELKNEGKADTPTKENVTERLNVNNPFYIKIEDALAKLGLIEKWNPETKTGDVIGGYVQPTDIGGFNAGKMFFNEDGSISYIDGDVKVSFDKNGNVISENTKEVAEKNKQKEIEGKKESIANLEKTRNSENFKYKEVTETDVLGNKKKVKRLKTEQELKESTDKINAAINKAKEELAELTSEKVEAEPQVPSAPEAKQIIEVKSPKEVKQGDTIVWRGEDFTVEEVNPKGGFNLKNVKDPTWTVKDARVTDEEFGGKRVGELTEEQMATQKLEELGKKQVEIKGKGTWRQEFNKETDPFRKSSILRAIADSSNNIEELNDIKEAAKEMPEKGNIINAVNNKLKSLGVELPPTKLKPEEYAIQEPTAGEVPVQPKAGVSEEVEGGVPPTEPKKVTKESKAESEKELDRLANNVPDTGKVAEYLSKGTIIKYTGEAPANEQARGIQELGIALEHGKKIIEKAKEVFGEDYVEKTLDYIENSTASVSNKALMYVSLENELVKEKLANPNRAGEITKQQALVYAQSQALARENSLSLNYQKLRQYAIKGYDRSIVTDQIYTSQELESKKDISSAIEASPEQVNQAAEEAEAEVEGAKLFTEQELEKKVEQGVRAEVDRLFNQLPKKDKTRAEKALDVLAKFKQKLRGRTYDATLGIPVAIIDAGITTIENAIKLGISIEKAIDLGIKKIKEGLRGKSWDKENDFREDMINAYKEAGIDTKAKTSPTTKKQIVKDALIKSGFGRTVTIKGQEREILDWKKLAGRAGTVENIQRNVENVLREEGYTQEEIDNSKEEFTKEYIDLRQSIIEKAQNELARRNKSTVSPKQKSAAKRLAELYTFGLFEQNRDEFDNLINSALGVQFDEKTFKEANKIAEAMENVYNQSFNGVRLNDLTGKSALENLNDKIRLLTVELSKKQGPWYFRAVNLLKGYMNFSQTMILNTLKNSTENLSSGAQQKLIDKLFLTIGKETTPELVKERRRLMKDIYKDMIVNGGIGYGKVENEFVNRRHIDDYVNKLSDKKLVQGIASVLTGKATLNAMDAMFKAGLTEARFTSNLVKILISPSNKNRMTKEEAVKFVSEQLTGQTIEDARVTAKDVIDKINKDAGQELIKPTKEQINRLANDIVKAALEMNGTITTEQMMAAYNAAYRSAGLSIGHESNNALTSQLRAWAANIESNINRSIKEKEWANATLWLLNSIFINNIVSPFVGGGTNWLVLKLEKTGLGLFTGLAYEASGKKELDLTTRTGLDQLERRLFTQSRAKDSYMRGAIGGLTSLLLYAGFMGIADEEEYRKWRGKNRWAVKYLDLITPEYLLASIAAKDKRLPQYVESSLLGKNEAFSITTKIVKSVNYAVKGDSPKTWGAVGETIGARLNAPLPWRLVRDGQILYDGIRGEDPYHGNYKPSVGFWSGVLQGGAIEWMGLRPMGKGKVQVAQFKVIDYQTEEERDATNEEIRQVENLSNILYKQYLPAYKSNTEDIWVAVGDKVKISKEGYSKKEVELWEEKSYNQLTKEQQDQLDELVQKKALKDAKIELDLKEKKE